MGYLIGYDFNMGIGGRRPVGMRTSHEPVFREAERVMVCLDTTAVQSSVGGRQQGKCTVKDNLVTRAGETWGLEEFIAAIRTAAR